MFRMREAKTLQVSVFTGHGCLSRAGRGWCGYHGLRYHIYLIASSFTLKEFIRLGYLAGFSVRKLAKTGKGKQKTHQHIDNTEEAKRPGDANKEKREDFDTESTE